jgi:hypothetical protein
MLLHAATRDAMPSSLSNNVLVPSTSNAQRSLRRSVIFSAASYDLSTTP